MAIKTEAIKTFWHEIGHYFPALYNKKDVLGITLERRNDIPIYNGEIKFVKLHYYDETKEISCLAEKIASLVYGCFFQGLYNGYSYYNCFSENNLASGNCDYKQFFKSLNKLGLKDKETELQCLFSKYYEEILKNDQNLKNLINGDKYKLFLEKEKEYYDIDIVKLNSTFLEYIELHKPIYEKFLLEIKKILN